MTRAQFLEKGAKLLRQCIKNPESRTAAENLDKWRKQARPTPGEVEQVRRMARSC